MVPSPMDESYNSPLIFDLPAFTRQFERPVPPPVLNFPKDQDEDANRKEGKPSGANAQPKVNAEKKATLERRPDVELGASPVAKKYKQTTLPKKAVAPAAAPVAGPSGYVIQRPKITLRPGPPK